MKEKSKDKEKISVFERIVTALKLICVIILILFIIVIALQRFSNNKIAVGGFRIFNVATGSMEPEYNVGDVLVIKEVNTDELKEGDDITYLGKYQSFAGRVVTHQIIKIEETDGGRIFHTKGIANETEDPTITADQIYGKVIYKCIFISMLTKLMNNMTAFYILVFIPLGLLIFLQIKERSDNSEDDENEEDDEEDNEDDVEEYDDEVENEETEETEDCETDENSDK